MWIVSLIAEDLQYQMLWNYFIDIIQDKLENYVPTEEDADVLLLFRLTLW